METPASSLITWSFNNRLKTSSMVLLSSKWNRTIPIRMESSLPEARYDLSNEPFGDTLINGSFLSGLQGEAHQCRSGKDTGTFSAKMHPYLLSRRQSLETQCLAQRLQVLSLDTGFNWPSVKHKIFRICSGKHCNL